MAKNKVLKKLRGILEGMPCGGDLVELLDNAVAREREQPEVQMAEHQARLVKAKADKAEWDLYMATEGLRVPSFVELPSESKPLEVCIAGLRFFVNKPTDTVSDSKGNTTMTAAIGVDVQSAEPVRRIFMEEFDANWGKHVAAPGIAESLSADQQAKRAEEMRAFRARSLFTQCQAAETRGFEKARSLAIKITENTKNHFCGRFSTVIDDALTCSKQAIADMKQEG